MVNMLHNTPQHWKNTWVWIVCGFLFKLAVCIYWHFSKSQ